MPPIVEVDPVPSCAVALFDSRYRRRTLVSLFAGLALLVGACSSSDSTTASTDTTSPVTGSSSATVASNGGRDTTTTSAAVATTLPLIELPPLPDGERAVTGDGGPNAGYTATWQIRPNDGEPYGYVVVKDGAERTAYRFADVLYVDDVGLDYVCVGLGGDPRCAFAADTGANTLVVDGARVRVQELGPFAFTNLAFIPEELGSDAPGLEMSERVVGRLETSCVKIAEGHALARFAGAEYCETTTNVVAWFDRTGDSVPEVELSLYDPDVRAELFEPAVAPVEDPALFAELVSAIEI